MKTHKWARVEKRPARFSGDYKYYVIAGATKKHKYGSVLGPWETEPEAMEAASRYRKS